ncbi:aspartic-type signal peptidase [Fusarium pseudoanthophilum]|uniref:Aspartic-type signal peptidase n=1 Tax=Fusarium pseudoanthophilum TaxID=48495 RepID=A0A8H5L055_9HYPO|nr:aspartic-type signal peptidase [Fusarium pseudoanthophilum]
MVHQYWLLAIPLLVLDAAQGVVAAHGKHTRKSNASPHGLHVLPLIADNSDDYHSWIAEVAAGTPPQKMRLNLDIAKSTTWFISDKTYAECEGCTNGYYQLNKSKTSSPVLGHTAISYGDPTTYPPSNLTFDLDFHKDTVQIAGVSIPKQVFGLFNPYKDEFSGIGALALGPNVEHGYAPGKIYSSFLDNLVANKKIASRTYSIDLHQHGSKPASIILGGVDTGKFKGKLVKRPLVKDELGTFGPSIALTGLSQTVPNGKNKAGKVTSYPVHKNDSVFLLDSSNQYLRFRHSFVDPLYKTLGAVNNGQDAYYVPCEKRKMPGSWDFQFGDVTIKIPYSKIITDQSGDKGKTCWVGVLTTWKGQLVLGQPFLEAAYLAFNLDNKQVALAPPANCGEKLVAFGSGPNAIPNLKGC